MTKDSKSHVQLVQDIQKYHRDVIHPLIVKCDAKEIQTKEGKYQEFKKSYEEISYLSVVDAEMIY